MVKSSTDISYELFWFQIPVSNFKCCHANCLIFKLHTLAYPQFNWKLIHSCTSTKTVTFQWHQIIRSIVINHNIHSGAAYVLPRQEVCCTNLLSHIFKLFSMSYGMPAATNHRCLTVNKEKRMSVKRKRRKEESLRTYVKKKKIV